MVEIKKITAKEAHHLSITSRAMIKHIYKFIEEMAKENMSSIIWDFNECNEEVQKSILDVLKSDGYNVSISEKYSNSIKISW